MINFRNALDAFATKMHIPQLPSMAQHICRECRIPLCSDASRVFENGYTDGPVLCCDCKQQRNARLAIELREEN